MGDSAESASSGSAPAPEATERESDTGDEVLVRGASGEDDTAPPRRDRAVRRVAHQAQQPPAAEQDVPPLASSTPTSQDPQLAERERAAGRARRYYAEGKTALAIEQYEQTLALEREILGDEHEDIAETLETLWELYVFEERFAEAREAAHFARDVYVHNFGEDDWRSEGCQIELEFVDLVEPLDPDERWRMFDAEIQAGVFSHRGEYEKAIEFQKRALTAYLKLVGREHPFSMSMLGSLALFHLRLERYDEAAPLLDELLLTRERIFGKDHPAYADALDNLAELHSGRENWEEAERLYLEALEIQKAAVGTDHPNYSTSLNNLAVLYDTLEDYEKAIPLYRQSLEIDPPVEGEWDNDYAVRLQNLANALLNHGLALVEENRFDEALELLVEAQRSKERLSGRDHWTVINIEAEYDLARELADLSADKRDLVRRANELFAEGERLEYEEDDNERALEKFEQAAQLVEDAVGREGMRYAWMAHKIADMLLALGRHDEAEPVYRHVGIIYRRILGPRHPDYATLLGDQGRLYYSLDEVAEAEVVLRQSVDIYEIADADYRTADDFSYYTFFYGDILGHLGQIYSDRGDYARAEPLFRRALELYRSYREVDESAYAQGLYDMGSLYMRMGDAIHAAPLLEESLVVTRETLGEGAPDYADRLHSLGSLYLDLEEYTDAEEPLLEAVQIYESLGDEYSGSYETALYSLGTNYRLMGEYARAEEIMGRVAELEESRDTSEDPDYAYTLNQLAILHYSDDEFDEAREYFERALTEWDAATQGVPDSFTTQLLFNLADALVQLIEYDEATARIEEAVAIHESTVRDAPADAAYNLGELAWLYQQMQFNEDALGLCQRALSICHDALSAEKEIVHADLATFSTTLSSLGSRFLELEEMASAIEAGRLLLAVEERLHGVLHWKFTDALLELRETQQMAALLPAELDELERADALIEYARELRDEGNHDGALAQMNEAYQAYRGVLGPTHRETIGAIIELAGLRESLGDLAGAEVHYADSVRLRELLLGTRHPDYSLVVSWLAEVYTNLGDFAQAERYFLLACEIDEEIYGRDHSWYADDLQQLAEVYNLTDEPAKGMPVAVEAAQIFKRLGGEENEDYLASLNLQAIFYHKLRDYERARTIHQHVMQQQLELYGEEDGGYITSLNNLAVVLIDMGEYADAEQMLERSLELRERVYGRRSYSYAHTLFTLGDLYRFAGPLDRSVEYFEQALALFESLRGNRAPETVDTMSRLAATLRMLGRYSRAELLLRKAMAARQQTPDERLPQLASDLHELALLAWAAGKPAEAFATEQQSLEIEQQRLAQLATATERDLQALQAATAYKLDHLLAMAAAQPDDPEIATAALDWTLRRKAVVLDAMCRLRAVEEVFTLEPEIGREANQLRQIRQRINDLTLNPPADLTPAEIQHEQTALAQQAQNIEARLRRTLQSRQATQVALAPDASMVREQLADDAALIEFALAPVYDSQSNEPYFAENHYFAFVLRGDGRSGVQMFDLGVADELDEQINELREMAEETPRSLRFASEAALEEEFWEPAQKLYDRLIEPLAEALAEIKTVYLAPDRQLHLVPFAALVNDDGHYLLETHRLCYLSTGRDLLREFDRQGQGTVVFAGPDYDLGLAERSEQLGEPGRMELAALAMRGDEEPQLRSLRWRPLPGAEQEANDVMTALADSPFAPVDVFAAADALEDVFKQIRSPRILHVATHGFFIVQEDREQDRLDDRRAAEPVPEQITAAIGMARLGQSSNPLMRSGLVLSGANELPGEGTTSADVEDGWVTAAEIAMIDLSGTELVVLSACESGLGDVSTREGVFGLRRSFFHAGAQALVTSLFKVPDVETRQLMDRFYEHLADDASKLDALRDAQLRMINERRQEGGAAHPFFWASFILVGDPS